MIEIAESALISGQCDIEDSVRGTRIVIGERVMIDSFVKIKPAGGSGDVVIGEDCYINSGTVIYTGNGIQMGKGVLIAANCTLAPVNHQFGAKNVPILSQGFKTDRGGIVIEDDVWIGANTVILDGTHIAKGAVIGAQSLVKGRVEPYGIYAGNPLKQIGERE